MRPLRYSINVTLDGCCDPLAGIPSPDLHRNAIENFRKADALILGRVIYQLMESAWRPPAAMAGRPEWMAPFARAINGAKKYVASRTLGSVDWNAELLRGDAVAAVQRLKEEPGKGLFVSGVKFPMALAELGLIDEYEIVVHPRIAGRGPALFAGLRKFLDLKLADRQEFDSGAIALRYVPA